VRLNRTPVNLAALVQRTVQTLTATGRAGGHQPSVSVEPVWVDADATRLEQVVTNLVENAGKFTPRDGTIRVAVRRDGDEAVCEVADTGQGIPPEVLPHVFELFAQGESAAHRTRGGLGLGLTLVERLITLHGGTVTAASPGVGAGSTFTVRLPASRPPESPMPSVPPGPAVTRPQRILVIDDHEDAREMLRTLLTLDGHKVEAVADGAYGVELARVQRPDVIIIDLGLPGLDGYEVARRVRGLPGGYRPRLIALTGYGQPEARLQATEAGFDVHLVKPADLSALRAALGEASS